MNLRETLYFKHCWDCDRIWVGTSEVLHNTVLYSEMDTSLLGLGSRMWCLEWICPHKLIGYCTIRMSWSRLVLLQEVDQWGWDLGFKMLKSCYFLFLMPAVLDVELWATSLAPCLPAYCHASCCEHNGQNAWNVSQPLLNAYLYKRCWVHSISSQQ